MPKLSVILPTTLKPYSGCAKDLPTKFERAIKSVMAQSFEDWELVIVSDGCDKAVELAKPYFYEYIPKIRLIQIEKQPTWSGAVRNVGIVKADGDYITYLDTDDYFGTDHLKTIAESLEDYDWIFYNDLRYKQGEFYENKCSFNKGMCGTSNVTHKKSLNVMWRDNSYLHDFVLIKDLMAASSNYAVTKTPQYHVCHLPNRYDI